MAKSKYKIAVIAPTSLFYQAALYRDLAVHPKIDRMVYFCSEEGITGRDIIKKFNTEGVWEAEDLLRGYKYKFLRNYSPQPSYLNWPIGLVNLGIWNELRKNRPDAVILMSWMNLTWWLAIVGCLCYKIPFVYLTDTNIQAEVSKPRWKSTFKNTLLGNVLFKLASGFLCVGAANKLFYQHYGVPDDKLVDFAFTWGYEDLLTRAGELSGRREQIRNELSLSKESVVILYVVDEKDLVIVTRFGEVRSVKTSPGVNVKVPFGFRAKMALNRSIELGQLVEVSSEAVDGWFSVKTIVHRGDNWGGEFVTEIEGIKANASALAGVAP